MAEQKKELQTAGTTNYPDEKKVTSMLTVENMAKLKKKYDPKLIPEAKEKGDEGYLVIHSMVMDITKVRTSVEARRKEIKKDALDFGKLVDSKAKKLTEDILAIEEPWKKLKIELDEKEAKEAEEARQKEAKRIEVIEAKVNKLKDSANGLLGLPVSRLKEQLRLITEVIVDETYDGYMEAAEHHKATAIQTIEAAIAERETFEEQQAQVKAEQAAAAEKQRLIDAENAETQRKLDEQQKAIADQQKENQRKLDEQQAEIDKQKAEQKTKDDAELQRKVDEAAAEKKRIEDEAAAEVAEKDRIEKEAALEARQPEDFKVRGYALALMDVKSPEVESEEMKKVILEVTTRVGNIADYVFNSTQGPTAESDNLINFTEEK